MLTFKIVGNLSTLLTALWTSAALAVPVTMVCVAKHPETEVQFTGEGIRWLGAHQAMKLCEAYAKSHQLDASACRIESCEAADLNDLNQ